MKSETATVAPTQISMLRAVIIFFPAFIGASIALHDLRITLALAAVHLGLITYFVRLTRGHMRIQFLLILATLVTLGGVFAVSSKLH
jgi:hypothetical protein